MNWKETDKRLMELGKELVEGACNAIKIDGEKELEEMNKGKRGAQYKIPL